jgi:hypothetical protein
MTSETLDKFDAFAHNMWAANCSERDAYGEPILRKEEYLSNNAEFLLDQFWLDWGNNRKWVKGEWKHEE